MLFKSLYVLQTQIKLTPCPVDNELLRKTSVHHEIHRNAFSVQMQ